MDQPKGYDIKIGHVYPHINEDALPDGVSKDIHPPCRCVDFKYYPEDSVGVCVECGCRLTMVVTGIEEDDDAQSD